MAWTYTPGSSAPRDVVRFLVGDTDAGQPLLQDEEIDFILSLHDDDTKLSAPEAAEAIAFKFAKRADSISMGRLSKSNSDLYAKYMKLAKKLRRTNVVYQPVAGGIGPTYLGPQKDDYDPNFTPGGRGKPFVPPFGTE